MYTYNICVCTNRYTGKPKTGQGMETSKTSIFIYVAPGLLAVALFLNCGSAACFYSPVFVTKLPLLLNFSNLSTFILEIILISRLFFLLILQVLNYILFDFWFVGFEILYSNPLFLSEKEFYIKLRKKQDKCIK